MYGIRFCNNISRLFRIRNYSVGENKFLFDVLANMRKANNLVSDVKQGATYKRSKYPPSNVYLEVVGSGARGAPNALYLFTDHNRYLFNCGESTQRIALEHKVKVSRLNHVFITNKSWKNLGGLPGLSITLQQVGVSDITLHGPEGLGLLYNATKGFVVMKDMNVNIAKCSSGEDYEDSALTIKYVLLSPQEDLVNAHIAKKPRPNDYTTLKEFEEFINDDTDYYNSKIGLVNRKARSPAKNKPKPRDSPVAEILKKRNDKVLAALQNVANTSVAYICTLKKRLGTLNLEKCVEKGVNPGPLLGKLKNGQDVLLPDGTLVLSSDVKNPDDPGPVFIVLEVPDISYLKTSEFQAHFDNGKNPSENIPVLIVHFSPPHVFHSPEYQTFMTLFGLKTEHLVLNEQNSCLGSEAVHKMQHKLHLMDQEIFPLLRDISIPAVWNTQLPTPKNNNPLMTKGLEELKNKIAAAQFQNIINLESLNSFKSDSLDTVVPGVEGMDKIAKSNILAGRTLTSYHLRPLKPIDRSREPKLHIQEYIQETMDVDGFGTSLDKFRKTVDVIRYSKSHSTKEYPKVVFLGTGSSMPGKTRNVSAIVVHTDEHRSILLDCGEGTYTQIVRFYGQKRASHFLKSLRAIYVSHLHADHHLGLIGIVQARLRAFQEEDLPPEPLYLLAPGQIMAWLSLYDKQFEKILGHITLIPNQNLQSEAGSHLVTAPTLLSMGLQEIRTCLVSHCPNAFGVALTIDDKYKITYSGDTIPCQELLNIGKNSTLLIHEATMEDELSSDARLKMHSTMSQAIDMGRQMNASYTVLTHFSQRYAHIPRLIDHLLENNVNVGIAYDYMQITMSDLDILPHMYAPLQLMFAEHCVEMELKAEHRQRNLDRKSTPSPISGTSFPPSTPIRHSSPHSRNNVETTENI